MSHHPPIAPPPAAAGDLTPLFIGLAILAVVVVAYFVWKRKNT